MPMNVSGGNNHYFHLQNDATQIKTAQRSTFQTSANTKISNFFLQKNKPSATKIGNAIKSIRNADLNFREKFSGVKAAATKSGNNSYARLQTYLAKGDTSKIDNITQRRDEKNSFVEDRLDLKKQRLQFKRDIHQAAPGDTENVAMGKTLEFQDKLRAQGYAQSSGDLSKQKVSTADPVRYSNDSFHRINANYQRAPLSARAVADLASRQHDAGHSGMQRALGRGALYGAVGLANTVALGKQGFYAAAQKMAGKDSEEEFSFQRHAAKARDSRKMNSAALNGNVALNQEFSARNSAFSNTVADRAEQLGYAETVAHPNSGGVAAPKTSYSARKIDQYFSKLNQVVEKRNAENSALAASGKESITETPADVSRTAVPGEKRKKLASAFVKLTNLKSQGQMQYHQWQATRWSNKSLKNDGNEQAALNAGKHEAKRFNAMFKVETRKAAVDGKMHAKINELANPEGSSLEDIDDIVSMTEKMWEEDSQSHRTTSERAASDDGYDEFELLRRPTDLSTAETLGNGRTAGSDTGSLKNERLADLLSAQPAGRKGDRQVGFDDTLQFIPKPVYDDETASQISGWSEYEREQGLRREQGNGTSVRFPDDRSVVSEDEFHDAIDGSESGHDRRPA